MRAELTVSLNGLRKYSLDMCSRIEQPEDPVVEAGSQVSTGAFYGAILEAFRNNSSLIRGTRQPTPVTASQSGRRIHTSTDDARF